MSGEWTQLDRAIEAAEHAMFELSKAAGQTSGPRMYALNRMWNGLNRTVGEMRDMRLSITRALPEAQKTL